MDRDDKASLPSAHRKKTYASEHTSTVQKKRGEWLIHVATPKTENGTKEAERGKMES
jgi:hypothetical protein